MKKELVLHIWNALGDDTVTTPEANRRLGGFFDDKCPDDLAKTFAKLRKQGLLKGKVSPQQGGWIWWADDECRSALEGGMIDG